MSAFDIILLVAIVYILLGVAIGITTDPHMKHGGPLMWASIWPILLIIKAVR